MINDIDIHRTAKMMIDQHGGGALIETMKRIEQYRQKGNKNGMQVWNRIANSIEWHLTDETLTGETLH